MHDISGYTFLFTARQKTAKKTYSLLYTGFY